MAKAKVKGYKREKPVFALHFADGQFEGLEVTAKSLPLKEFFAVQRLAADNDPDSTEKLIKELAGILVSWNLLDDDDNPVPATYEGLVGQDLSFVTAIITAWLEAVASVPPTSPGSSNGGATSLELSLPME